MSNPGEAVGLRVIFLYLFYLRYDNHQKLAVVDLKMQQFIELVYSLTELLSRQEQVNTKCLSTLVSPSAKVFKRN